MSSLLSFVKVVFCSSCNNIFLMHKVIFKHLVKIKHLRLVIYQGKHNNAKCILKLCMLI